MILSLTSPGHPCRILSTLFHRIGTIEAKLIADQLMEQGIPAIADKIDIKLVMGGFHPQIWLWT